MRKAYAASVTRAGCPVPSGGPELKSWPPDDGTGLLEAWLKGFFAVSAVLDGPVQDPGRGFLVLVLALLTRSPGRR
jgi:hypothetical protein